MYVVLPETGCNILSSNSSFYNYSPDGRTRTTYIIYDGTAHPTAVNTSQMGYTYTGTCMVTGDLVYKPELDVYFPIIAFCITCFITIVIYHILVKRLMP